MYLDIFILLYLANNYECTKEKIYTDEAIRVMLNQVLFDYDQRLRPDYLGEATEVLVDATILSFTNLDAIKMMYTVDMFFRQRWRDHRLKHNMTEPLTIIVGTKHPADIIWTPDTVFINSVFSRLHHVTVNNHKIDIAPDGNVFWGTRVTVSPKCYLNLMAYPMDVQMCQFELVSYTYSSRHLRYKWKTNPGVHILDTQMAQFRLKKFKTKEEEKLYVAGNFTVLTGIFQFERLMGFAVLQIYVPSTAIVCVSWVSLWIERQATPARVALCITTLLTISTIWSSVNSQLPRVNYVKAIDVYLMTSFCCVIFTLVEYTIVLNAPIVLDMFRERKKKKLKKLKGGEKRLLLSTSLQVLPNHKSVNTLVLRGEKKETTKEEMVKIEDEKEKEKKLKKKIDEENERISMKIEQFARIFFPVTYIIFNIFYWTIYISHEHPDISN